jgi:tryptophanyl-tRNA synthetase
MTEVRTSAGGVRLTTPHLHFGHYVGTFAAAHQHSERRVLYYLIKDTEPFLWSNPQSKRSAIRQLVIEALAIAPDGIVVKPLITSRILHHAWRIGSIISDLVRYSSLVTAHFSKEKIRKGSYSDSVRNFLFPLDEATVFTFLSVERFYSNQDNERIIRFVRDVQRMLRRRYQFARDLPLTELCHFPGTPFLPGADHRRMHTSAMNVLPVITDKKTIIEFCRASFRLGHYFDKYPAELERFRSEGASEFVPSQPFMPFTLIRVLRGERELLEFVERYSTDRMRREQLAEHLAGVVWDYVAEWRSRAAILFDDAALLQRVLDESERIGLEAAETWESDL